MEEDRALATSGGGTAEAASSNQTDEDRTRKELNFYRSLPDEMTSINTVVWWLERKHTMPVLFDLSNWYLCPQASSTPSERVFSTAGDTASAERSQLLPENVDMTIFLKKNAK